MGFIQSYQTQMDIKFVQKVQWSLFEHVNKISGVNISLHTCSPTLMVETLIIICTCC